MKQLAKIVEESGLEMDNEIKKSEPNAMQLQTDAPPMVQVAQLLASGVDIDVDKMAKIQEMAERYEDNMARKAFFDSMSAAQAEIEGAVKTKKNIQTNSMYATLENVLEVAKPVYTKHGFSVLFSEGKADKESDIRVCADVLHRDGHERQYHLDLERDDKGIKGTVNKTSIHGKASTMTYARRYLMCQIWNIPTPDNDGNVPKPEPEIVLNDKQIDYIEKVKISIEDNLDGEKVLMDNLIKYLNKQARLIGKQVPEDSEESDRLLPVTVQFILRKPDVLTYLKGHSE